MSGLSLVDPVPPRNRELIAVTSLLPLPFKTQQDKISQEVGAKKSRQGKRSDV